MQKAILNCMYEDNVSNNNQYRNNKFFDNQFSRNHQSNKIYHFNKFERNDKLNNHFNAQVNNKRTHAEMKNEKINHCFEYYKSEHFHRDCLEKNK